MKADECLQVNEVPYKQMCINDIIYTSKFQINIFRKKNVYIKIKGDWISIVLAHLIKNHVNMILHLQHSIELQTNGHYTNKYHF